MSEVKRKKTSRIFRFWCWLWYGHDKRAGAQSTEVCERCGALIVGNDLY